MTSLEEQVGRLAEWAQVAEARITLLERELAETLARLKEQEDGRTR